MAQLLNFETGAVEEVADESVTEAVASGMYGLKKGEVFARDQQGKRFAIPTASAADAFRAGLRFELPSETQEENERKEFEDRPIAAGAAAVARGATIGISDPLLAKSGLVPARTLRGLKEHNEEASVVGEVAGTVATAFIPGLGGANIAKTTGTLAVGAAKIATKGLAEGLTKKVLERGVAGALEGAVAGVGNAVSEATLGETELTAQKLVSSMGVAALIGGGAGALTGGAEALAQKGLKKLGDALPENIEETAEYFANKNSVKALAIQSNLTNKSPEQIQDLGRRWLDLGIVKKGFSAEDSVQRAKEVLRESGEQIGESLSRLDANAVNGQRFNPAQAAKRIRDEILSELDDNPLNANVRKQIEEQAGYLEELGDRGMSFVKADKVKRGFDPHLKYDRIPTPEQEALMRVRGIVNDELVSQAEEVAISAGDMALRDSLLDARKAFGAAAEAEKIGLKAVRRAQGNRSVTLTDYLSGIGGAVAGVATGNPIPLALGVGGAVANKWFREKGSQFLATALDQISKNKPLMQAAKGFQEAVKKAAVASPDLLGPYSSLLANAAAKGAPDLFAVHAQLSEEPEYMAALQKAGLTSPAPDSRAMGRATRLSALADQIAEHDQEVTSRMDAFFRDEGGGEGRAMASLRATRQPLTPEGRGIKARLSAFEARLSELAQMASNPALLAEGFRLDPSVQDAAPGVAGAMATTASNALAYLYSKAPKPPHPEQIPALRRAWAPSEAELSSFERTMAAIQKPLTVLDDLKRGTISREAVDAIQAVYPRFADEIKTRVVERMSKEKEPLSYSKRLALSALLGPMDDALQPEIFSRLQGHFAQARAEAQKPPAAQGRLMKLPNAATAAQRGERRGT